MDFIINTFRKSASAAATMEDRGREVEQLKHLLAREPTKPNKEAALKLRQYRRAEWLQKHGCITCVANKDLTAIQKAEIEDCFKLMDSGGLGVVDVQEVLGALHSMRINVDKADIKMFLRDINSQAADSTCIDFEAFSALMTYALRRSKSGRADTSTGQVKFTDAVRAFRRKKLIQSLKQGGETREQIMNMYARTQQLMTQELEELRNKVKAHDEGTQKQLDIHHGLAHGHSIAHTAVLHADKQRSKTRGRLEDIVNNSFHQQEIVSQGTSSRRQTDTTQVSVAAMAAGSDSSRRRQTDTVQVPAGAAGSQGAPSRRQTDTLQVQYADAVRVQQVGDSCTAVVPTQQVQEVDNQQADSQCLTHHAVPGNQAPAITAVQQAHTAQQTSEKALGPVRDMRAELQPAVCGAVASTGPQHGTHAATTTNAPASDASHDSDGESVSDTYVNNEAITKAAARRRRSAGVQRGVEAGLPTKLDGQGRVVLKWDAVNPLQAHQFGFLHAKLAHRLRAHRAECMPPCEGAAATQHEVAEPYRMSRQNTNHANRSPSSQRRSQAMRSSTTNSSSGVTVKSRTRARLSNCSRKSLDNETSCAFSQDGGSEFGRGGGGDGNRVGGPRLATHRMSGTIGSRSFAAGSTISSKSGPDETQVEATAPTLCGTVADKVDAALLRYFGQMQARSQQEEELQDQHVKRACVAKVPGSHAGTTLNPYFAAPHIAGSRVHTPASQSAGKAACKQPATGQRPQWGVRQPRNNGRPCTQQCERPFHPQAVGVWGTPGQGEDAGAGAGAGTGARGQTGAGAEVGAGTGTATALQAQHQQACDCEMPVPKSSHRAEGPQLGPDEQLLTASLQVCAGELSPVHSPDSVAALQRPHSRQQGQLDAAVLRKMPLALAYRAASCAVTASWPAGLPEPVMTQVVLKRSLPGNNHSSYTAIPELPVAQQLHTNAGLDDPTGVMSSAPVEAAGAYSQGRSLHDRKPVLASLHVPIAECSSVECMQPLPSVPSGYSEPQPQGNCSPTMRIVGVPHGRCASPSSISTNMPRPSSPPKQDPRLHGDLPSPQLWAASLRADVHTFSPPSSPTRSRSPSHSPPRSPRHTPSLSSLQTPPRSPLRPQTCPSPTLQYSQGQYITQGLCALPEFAQLMLEDAGEDSMKPGSPLAPMASCSMLFPVLSEHLPLLYASSSPTAPHSSQPHNSIQKSNGCQPASSIDNSRLRGRVGTTSSSGGALSVLHSVVPGSYIPAATAALQQPLDSVAAPPSPDLESLLAGRFTPQTAWSSGHVGEQPALYTPGQINVRALSPSHQGGKLRVPGHPLQPPRQDARRHQLLPSPQLWASSLRADLWASRPATSPTTLTGHGKHGFNQASQPRNRALAAGCRGLQNVSVADSVEKLQAVMFRSGGYLCQPSASLHPSPSTVVHSQSHTDPATDLYAGVTPELVMHWHDSLDRMKLSLVRRADVRAQTVGGGNSLDGRQRGSRRQTSQN